MSTSKLDQLVNNRWRPESWDRDRERSIIINESSFKIRTKPPMNTDTVHLGGGNINVDEGKLMQEYRDAGEPTMYYRLGREHAYTTEGCIMLICYDNLNEVLPGHGWGPAPKSPRPFVIRPIPGKGTGMLAERDIKAGELIHKERILFAMPRSSPNLSLERLDKMIQDGLDMLPKRMREAFLALHNCKALEEWGPLAGTLMTNTIGVDFKQVKLLQRYSAVFPEISRANHSCCPNAAYGRFDSERCTIELRASRDIPKDSEVTVAYTDLYAPRDQRRKVLLDCYGFHCACESCTLSKKKSQESDARRARIVRLAEVFVKDPLAETQLEKWINDRSMPENALISLHLEALVAIEKEKDDQDRPEHCGVIAACYAALGDEENTKKWCAKADAYCRADIRDPNEELENIWAAYKNDPHKHPLWSCRTKDRLTSA